MARSRVSAVAMFTVALILGIAAWSPGDVQPTAPPADIEALAKEFGGDYAFTDPNKDAAIGFQVSTQVMEVAVSGGQRVIAGELLVRGDDTEETALLRSQEERAATDLPVRRAREQHELARVEHEIIRGAFEQGAANAQELNRAAVSERIAAIDEEAAEWSHRQEVLQVERFRTRVARYSLRAPFDGRVESVTVVPGDSIRESEPVVRVVSIDPLHIDVHTPISTTLSLGLDVGDPAWALIDVPGRPRVLPGRVIEVSPVANFASRRQRIRIEIPNPEEFPAGLAAWVRFTDPPAIFSSMIVSHGESPGGGGD